MKGVEKFEDLIAWQKARWPGTGRISSYKRARVRERHWLAGQIQRAAVSIMANIAEGLERNRSGEFHQFLSVAKGSCAEVRSHLYAAHDAGYLSQSRFTELLVQAEEVGRIVGGLRASAASRKKQPHNSDGSVLSTQHSAHSTQN